MVRWKEGLFRLHPFVARPVDPLGKLGFISCQGRTG